MSIPNNNQSIQQDEHSQVHATVVHKRSRHPKYIFSVVISSLLISANLFNSSFVVPASASNLDIDLSSGTRQERVASNYTSSVTSLINSTLSEVEQFKKLYESGKITDDYYITVMKSLRYLEQEVNLYADKLTDSDKDSLEVIYDTIYNLYKDNWGKKNDEMIAMMLPFAAKIVFTGTLDNFTSSSSEASFSDVSPTAWYYDSISEVSAYGIINGMPDGSFNPNGQLTYAQALTLATKINAIYRGVEPPSVSSTATHWAEDILDYANDMAITSDLRFELNASNLDNPCTRAHMALFFKNAIVNRYSVGTALGFNSSYEPTAEGEILEAINPANYAKDYDICFYENDYFSAERAVLTLFEAGIIVGDESGSFNLSAPITRAETATIILRLVNPKERVKVTTSNYSPQPYSYSKEALEMIDLVNNTRSNLGLDPLTLDPGLCRAAQIAATHYSMGSDPHYLLDGRVAGDLRFDLQLELAFSHNYGYGYRDSDAFHTGIMNSPGHASHVKSDSNDYYGAAMVKGKDGRTYWVECFATKPKDKTPATSWGEWKPVED